MKKLCCMAAVAACLLPTMAQATTLAEALAEAYNSNPTLQAGRAGLRSVDENVAIAKSGYRPNIYIGASYDKANIDDSSLAQDYDSTKKSASATLEQSLFSGFQTVYSVKSADSAALAGQFDLFGLEQSVFLSSATAYLDVLQNAAIVKLQYNNEELLKKKLEETKERFNVGEVTRTDVSQAKARYSRAMSDRISAEGNLEASKAVYQNVIGIKPKLLSEPADVKKFLPQSLDEALGVAEAQNYSVKGAQKTFEAKDYDVATKRGAFLPTVNFSASVSTGNSDIETRPNDVDTDTLSYGVTMKMPLYASGESRAKLRQSKYNKWQAQEQVLSAKRQVIADVMSSWEYMVANESQIAAIKDEVTANEIALDGVQKEEALGNRTVLDVLDAYQEVLSSKVEEVKATRNYYVSSMQLLLSMGKLTAQGLNLPVELYDADAYYQDTRGKWLSTSID